MTTTPQPTPPPAPAPHISAPIPSPLPDPSAGVKPGYQTTEFWATQVSSGLALAFALGADFGIYNLSGQQKADVTLAALFAVGFAQAAYSVGRSIVKHGSA